MTVVKSKYEYKDDWYELLEPTKPKFIFSEF